MNNRQNITNISVSFQGIAKGKRKSAHHIVRLAQVNDHIMLNDDQITAYTNQAWGAIDKIYKITSNNAALLVNHGHDENGMTFIMLLSKQRITITKANV